MKLSRIGFGALTLIISQQAFSASLNCTIDAFEEGTIEFVTLASGELPLPENDGEVQDIDLSSQKVSASASANLIDGVYFLNVAYSRNPLEGRAFNAGIATIPKPILDDCEEGDSPFGCGYQGLTKLLFPLFIEGRKFDRLSGFCFKGTIGSEEARAQLLEMMNP